MLGQWIDTCWTNDGDGSMAARLHGPLPAALLDLAGSHDDGPLGLSPRARGGAGRGAGLGIVAGLGYRRARRVAAEVSMRFDPATRMLRIAPAERARLDARWAAAALRPAEVLPPVGSGIGATLEHRQISPDLGTILSQPGGRLLATSDRSLWVGAPIDPDAAQDLPDAVLFHDDALPAAMTLTVEATTACNYRCGFCYGRHIAQGIMRLPEFLAVLERLPPLTAVEFTGEGEPLMNRDVPEMIRACKARGAWVHLTTNGSRMTRARAELIVDLGIDAVATSMETLDPARFARLRPGGDLAEVQGAIACLAATRAERGRGPELLLWVTLLKSSLGEIDAFLDYAEQAGFAKVEFQVLNRLAAYRRFYGPELESELLDPADLRAARDAPATSPRARRVLEEVLATQSGRRCDIFMGSTMVYWQGAVTPCRLLKVPQHPVCGDARTTPLEQIWQDPGFRNFRFALQHGVVLNACDGCAYVAAA